VFGSVGGLGERVPVVSGHTPLKKPLSGGNSLSWLLAGVLKS